MPDSPAALPTHVGVYGGGRMGAGIAHTLPRGWLPGRRSSRATSGQRCAARERVVSEPRQGGRARRPVRHRRRSRGPARPPPPTPDDLAGSSWSSRRSRRTPTSSWPSSDASSRSRPTPCWPPTPARCRSTAIAAGLRAPERFIGLHFFNPVPASDLVEVVVGEHTADPLVEQARGWVAALGKTAITVKDSPGFASSRLGVAIALEAMRMVQEGVASARGHRHRDDARLPPPRGPAEDHRHRRPRRAAGHRRAPGPRAGPAVRRRRSCCATRSPRASWVARAAAASTTGEAA